MRRQEAARCSVAADKQGQAEIVLGVLLLLGSLAVASAALMNATEENTTLPQLNLIPPNISFENETVPSLGNNSPALGQPPGENMINATPETSPKPKKKNITEAVERQKGKLNPETEEYLKQAENEEQRSYLVKFKDSIPDDLLQNVTIKGRNNLLKVRSVEAKAEDISGLLDEDAIEGIEHDQDVEILGEAGAYHLSKVGAPSVWNLANGSGVKVAILDTGIAQHDDLAVAGGFSVVDNNYYDANGHGTAVAGVLAAALNGQGIAGVAPSASLYSVKIMQGSSGQLSDAISGIEWAIENNMSIVSMSFGFDSYSNIFKDVLQEAYDSGIVLVAASGNEGSDAVLYPAAYSTVIAVGATSENDQLAYFSSYGPEQELVAPGVDINTTKLGNDYGTSSGTSLAAPQVAGVAALLKSYNHSLTNVEIRNKLRNDAKDLGAAGWDEEFGYGLVQINLTSSNFTFVNDSYFYEIFNITDYGLLNVYYWFWLSGNGTVDDVEFLTGYYLVNITYQTGVKKSEIYNVTENGTIFTLTTNLAFQDFFQTEGGTSSDRVAWIDDNITIRIDSTLSTIEAECFTVGAPQQFNTFDYCFFDTSPHKTECDDGDPDILCDGSHTNCQISSQMEVPRLILDYASAHSEGVEGRAYGDCTNPGTAESASSQTYYVVDRKAALCINSSHYNISGWHGTNWITYDASSCSSGYICVTTQNYTTESANINPCLQQNLCTGQIQVITEDRDGNPIPNLRVSRDSVSNKTTDSFGVATYTLTQNCGQNLQFTAYCPNNVSVCNSKTTVVDTINDYEGILFDCSACTGLLDMQVNVEDMKVNKGSNQVTVNISLLNIPTTSNINITFKVQGNDGLISQEKSQLFSVSSGDTFKFITQSITFADADDFLHAYADINNKVAEQNEKNNYALVPLFEPELQVYLNISTGYPLVDQKIKDYLKFYVKETSQSQAQVTIAVGLPNKNSVINSKNSFTRQNYKWWIDNKISYNNQLLGSKPYNGIVGAFRDDKNYIFVAGNDVDGLLAATKRLASARSLFFSNLKQQKVSIIEDKNIAGISVADLLRNPSNWPYYSRNRTSERFAEIVERILNNNNFEIAIRTVQTTNDNTTLRMKNINTDYSQNFKDAIVNNSRPVVLSRGIHSNLFTWEDFGQELAFDENAARDTWLIEMVGGPTIDEDCAPSGRYNCPNYTFNDLVDYY